MSLTSILVGAHFRPPAKLLLEHLPSGTPVLLEPEPDNPYDENAVKVWLAPGEIPASEYDELREALVGFGTSLDEILATDRVHLGYVAASGGKPLAIARERREGLVGNEEVTAAGLASAKASLTFAPDGELLLEIGA